MRTQKVQDAKTKIRQIFQFLAAVQKIRTPPARHLTEYDWHLYFDDLQKEPSIVTVT